MIKSYQQDPCRNIFYLVIRKKHYHYIIRECADTLPISPLIAPHKHSLYQSRVHHSDRTGEQREGNGKYATPS
jgi:hypothetical protein